MKKLKVQCGWCSLPRYPDGTRISTTIHETCMLVNFPHVYNTYVLNKYGEVRK